MNRSLNFKKDLPQLPENPTTRDVAVFVMAWMVTILTVFGLLALVLALVGVVIAALMLIPASLLYVLFNWIMPFVGINTVATFGQCFVGSVGLAVVSNIIRFYIRK